MPCSRAFSTTRGVYIHADALLSLTKHRASNQGAILKDLLKMAAAPVNPPSPDDAAQAVAAVSSWWTALVGALSAVGSGGFVWGVTRSTLADHGRRIEELEGTVKDGMQRIEDKIDRNHNLIVNKLIPNSRD